MGHKKLFSTWSSMLSSDGIICLNKRLKDVRLRTLRDSTSLKHSTLNEWTDKKISTWSLTEKHSCTLSEDGSSCFHIPAFTTISPLFENLIAFDSRLINTICKQIKWVKMNSAQKLRGGNRQTTANNSYFDEVEGHRPWRDREGTRKVPRGSTSLSGLSCEDQRPSPQATRWPESTGRTPCSRDSICSLAALSSPVCRSAEIAADWRRVERSECTLAVLHSAVILEKGEWQRDRETERGVKNKLHASTESRPARSDIMPITPVIGVRISWLMVAKNLD